MKKTKDFLFAMGSYVLFFAVIIGLVWLSGSGNSKSAPESDPAIDAYEAQQEAESQRVDVEIQQQQAEDRATGDCVDVTSYDYDWSNDMLCTRPNGSKFYTSYDGAREYTSGY